VNRVDSENSAVRVTRWWIVFALVLLLATSAASAERPEGLLWNRSGLPATLPLQVKTQSGSDYLLQLRETGSGETVLAAYIRGGEFFRVLVPAGRYELLFSSGTEWKGEAAQFGQDPFRFVLDPPLTFRANVARKNGHLIDLRDIEDITIRDFAICQRFAIDPGRPLRGLEREAEDLIPRQPPHQNDQFLYDPYYPWSYELQSRFCD